MFLSYWFGRPRSGGAQGTPYTYLAGSARSTAYCSRLTAHSYNMILTWAFSRRVLTHSANNLSISC
jgi:hypothetical protein